MSEQSTTREKAEEAPGSSFELAGALAAVLLALVGLLGGARLHMAAFGTIAAGFALVAHGGTLATRWSHAVHLKGRERTEAAGIATEIAGGLAVITLGVIAASDVRPFVVLPVAMLVLGLSLILGGPTQPALAPAAAKRRWTVTRDIVRAGSGVMVMAGLASLVVGLFALGGGPTLTLTLIGVLCVAGSLLVAGGALTARIARRYA